MGLFSANKKHSVPVMPLYIDIHSHALPGIDDGSPDIQESLEMIRAFQAQGFKKIITTPHVHSQRYMNTTQDILNAADKLFEAMDKENISFPVEIAAEYYADKHLLDLLEQDDILYFGEKYVLCEFSFFMPPVGSEKIALELINAGYQPVLAHPERYEYWAGNASVYERLRNQQFLFQPNMPAALGLYGPAPKLTFDMLAEKGWIEFLGSDAHNAETVDLLGDLIRSKPIQHIIQAGILNHNL
ncbi:MAG: CpsB/CapC family capsule biosynthesis tyrosine phosphatase [Bacteroidales bacterium]